MKGRCVLIQVCGNHTHFLNMMIIVCGGDALVAMIRRVHSWRVSSYPRKVTLRKIDEQGPL